MGVLRGEVNRIAVVLRIVPAPRFRHPEVRGKSPEGRWKGHTFFL